jgi:hypothetical protein
MVRPLKNKSHGVSWGLGGDHSFVLNDQSTDQESSRSTPEQKAHGVVTSGHAINVVCGNCRTD